MLDEGKRAVTVRVDDVRGVAGFILPGDHVDVALIRRENGQRYSDLLLQNVKVVAIDQIANEQRDKPTVAKAVTLEVTPQQAQKISLATDVGRLSLILRQAGEVDTVADSRVTEADLGAPDAVQNKPEPVSSPPPPPEEKAVPVEKAAVRPDIATVTIVRNLKGLDYRVVRDSAGMRNGSAGVAGSR
jgi:pilus assembly protein CpaB